MKCQTTFLEYVFDKKTAKKLRKLKKDDAYVEIDDKFLSKTTKKANSKNLKDRVYGVDVATESAHLPFGGDVQKYRYDFPDIADEEDNEWTSLFDEQDDEENVNVARRKPNRSSRGPEHLRLGKHTRSRDKVNAIKRRKFRHEFVEDEEVDESDLGVGDLVEVNPALNVPRNNVARIKWFAPSGSFCVVEFANGREASIHVSDIVRIIDEDELSDDEYDSYVNNWGRSADMDYDEDEDDIDEDEESTFDSLFVDEEDEEERLMDTGPDEDEFDLDDEEFDYTKLGFDNDIDPEYDDLSDITLDFDIEDEEKSYSFNDDDDEFDLDDEEFDYTKLGFDDDFTENDTDFDMNQFDFDVEKDEENQPRQFGRFKVTRMQHEEDEEEPMSSEEAEKDSNKGDETDSNHDMEYDRDDSESDSANVEDSSEDENEDPDRQGIIRTVDHAHLVYKRQTPDGLYDELWMYKIGDKMNDELEIRRNILAGTDIPPTRTKSKEGSQSYELWTVGNVQMLHITGLPN